MTWWKQWWWQFFSVIKTVTVSPSSVVAPGSILTVNVTLSRPAPAAGRTLHFSATPDVVTFSGGGTVTVPAGGLGTTEQGQVTGTTPPHSITVSTGGESKTVNMI